MKLQVKGNYVYITLWDKQLKRPRRFYLGRKEELKKWEELLRVAREYRVSEEEINDYLNFYLDKKTNLTKTEYVLLSFTLGVEFWNGSPKTPSEQQ